MTSKHSFYNLIKEEWKHHVVSMFLVVIYFLGRLLFYYFDIQQILSYPREVEDIIRLVNATAAPSQDKMVLIIAIAVIMAAEYFSYLHSRKKSDFYFSLPMGRMEKFLLGAVVNGSMFIVPFTLEKCFEAIIAFSTGYATVAYMKYAMFEIICTILIYAANWITMTLAMIMTGHLVIAIIGYGLLCSYVPAFLKELIPMFEAFFYETYSRTKMSEWWSYFSPISLSAGLTAGYREWEMTEHINYVIAIIIFIFCMSIVSMKMYNRRPAEAAGRAMAFEKMNTFIKFAIVVPASLYCGYILSEFAVGDIRIWLIVGIVIGVILSHGIVESIYRFDIRGMFAKKKHLVLNLMICIGFVAVFWVDVFHYDEYVPEAESVEYVEIEFHSDGIDLYSSYYDEGQQMKNRGITGEYIKVALCLAENLVRQLDNNADENVHLNVARAEIQTASYDVAHISDLSSGTITFEYHLKNGSTKSRRYTIDLEKKENVALLDLLCSSEDYKEEIYELYRVDSKEIQEIELSNLFKTEKVILSPEEQNLFINIYKKELTELSYTEMNEFDKIAMLRFSYGEDRTEECYIYNVFEETIEFLGNHGYEVKSIFEDAEIIALEIEQEYLNTDGAKKEEYWNEPPYVLRDSEVLNRIKQDLLVQDLYTGNVYGIKNARPAIATLNINGVMQMTGVLIRQETLSEIMEHVQE